MTNADIEMIGREMATATRDYVTRTLAERDARIAALETTLAALQEKGVLHYAGTWQPRRLYDKGACVTRAGALWTCTETHVGTDEFTHTTWKLTVKSGDAR